jgi:lipoprotein-releasing system permease protein
MPGGQDGGPAMYELLIARRYLRSMRRRKRVSFTVMVAVMGVGLGVAALVIVLSVSNGFSALVWDRLLGVNAHATVRKKGGQRIEDPQALLAALAAHPQVAAVSPFVASEGAVLHRSFEDEVYSAGVMVRGVTPDGLKAVSDLADHIWGGALDLGPQETEGRGRMYGILIGRYLADQLGVRVGSEVHLWILPHEIFAAQTRFRRYIVTGIFSSGNPEFDSGLAYVSLMAARRDLGWERQITGVRLRFGDAFRAQEISSVVEKAAGRLDPALAVHPWMRDHGNLYFSIHLEKWASFLGIGLIVVVAGFNIVSVLTMNVAERRREIGILKALGVPPRKIGRIFTWQGLAVGLSGVLLGNLLGLALCWTQQRFELLKIPGDVLITQALPVEMQVSDFFAISASAALICYLFTLFPARDAAALDPVEAIRM